jgi:hypothetical protein
VASSTSISTPFLTSQMADLPVPPHVASVRPSGLNAPTTSESGFARPASVRIRPESMSSRRRRPSMVSTARVPPSGLMAAESAPTG